MIKELESFFNEQDYKDIEDGDLDKFMILLSFNSYIKNLFENKTIGYLGVKNEMS